MKRNATLQPIKNFWWQQNIRDAVAR